MKEQKENSTNWWPLILLSLLIVIIWIFSHPLLKMIPGLEDWNKIGVFGDSFGAVNALFSGLAFAGLIYTINMQRQELKLQREELRMARNELKGQKEEFKIQNDTLKT